MASDKREAFVSTSTVLNELDTPVSQPSVATNSSTCSTPVRISVPQTVDDRAYHVGMGGSLRKEYHVAIVAIPGIKQMHWGERVRTSFASALMTLCA